jgi:hypothetical protein
MFIVAGPFNIASLSIVVSWDNGVLSGDDNRNSLAHIVGRHGGNGIAQFGRWHFRSFG